VNSSNSISTNSSLKVTNLCCERGFNRLFEDINFEVNQGVALKINGANGSGKTTLLRAIARMHRPEAGKISWNGFDIFNQHEESNYTLNYLGHKNGLNADLSPLENLRFFGSLISPQNDLSEQSALQQVGLSQSTHIPTHMLSAGQKQRVALARLTLNDSRLWILDEPATALDSDAICMLETMMQTHLNSNGIILFTSHQKLDLGKSLIDEISLS
jgi:heme exporter protein A